MKDLKGREVVKSKTIPVKVVNILLHFISMLIKKRMMLDLKWQEND